MFIVVKIKKLLVRALETGSKVSHCWTFLTYYIRVEISIILLTYILFILQCQKIQNKDQVIWKWQKQGLFSLFLMMSSAYTVTISYSQLVLHESRTFSIRKALLDPWLHNTEVYLTSLLGLKITQLQDKNVLTFSLVNMKKNIKMKKE